MKKELKGKLTEITEKYADALLQLMEKELDTPRANTPETLSKIDTSIVTLNCLITSIYKLEVLEMRGK